MYSEQDQIYQSQSQVYPSQNQYMQDPQYAPQEIMRPNKSTIRKSQVPQFNNQSRQFTEEFHQPASIQPSQIQPQYQPEAYQYSHQPPMNYGVGPQHIGGQRQSMPPPEPQTQSQNISQVNMMIEEQKKIIEMYQTTLQQIIEFQKNLKLQQHEAIPVQKGKVRALSDIEVYQPSPPKETSKCKREITICRRQTSRADQRQAVDWAKEPLQPAWNHARDEADRNGAREQVCQNE